MFNRLLAHKSHAWWNRLLEFRLAALPVMNVRASVTCLSDIFYLQKLKLMTTTTYHILLVMLVHEVDIMISTAVSMLWSSSANVKSVSVSFWCTRETKAYWYTFFFIVLSLSWQPDMCVKALTIYFFLELSKHRWAKMNGDYYMSYVAVDIWSVVKNKTTIAVSSDKVSQV